MYGYIAMICQTHVLQVEGAGRHAAVVAALPRAGKHDVGLLRPAHLRGRRFVALVGIGSCGE